MSTPQDLRKLKKQIRSSYHDSGWHPIGSPALTRLFNQTSKSKRLDTRRARKRK